MDNIEQQTERNVPQYQSIIWIISILIIGIIIGAVSSYYYFSPKSYQLGFNYAKALVEKSSLGQFIPAGLNTITGKVISINGNRIVINAPINDPFIDPSLANRTVLIIPSTKVTALKMKDTKTFNKEVVAYGLNPKTKTPYPLYPTLATISDIKKGSTITVYSSKNIKTVNEFTANSIQIQPASSSFR